jgi:hypothetical protein
MNSIDYGKAETVRQGEWLRPTAFEVVGWIASLAIAAGTRQPLCIAFTLGIFLLAVLLAVRSTFDAQLRRRTLSIAWIGPIFISLVAFGEQARLDLVPLALLEATARAAFMTWMFRFYGMFLVVNLVGVIMPTAKGINDAENGYPPRWWWVMPLFFAAIPLLKLLAFQMLMRDLMAPLPEVPVR